MWRCRRCCSRSKFFPCFRRTVVRFTLCPQTDCCNICRCWHRRNFGFVFVFLTVRNLSVVIEKLQNSNMCELRSKRKKFTRDRRLLPIYRVFGGARGSFWVVVERTLRRILLAAQHSRRFAQRVLFRKETVRKAPAHQEGNSA